MARRKGTHDVWRRFRRNRLAVAGLILLVVMLAMAILQPVITPYDPYEQNLRNTLEPPSADHWFGTDALGRDLYSGILYGLRLAFVVGLATMVGSLLVGLVLGGLAGFLGGRVDSVIMRTTDIFLAFPLLIGAILIVQVFGSSLAVVIAALVILGWPVTARLMRGQVLQIGQAEYVEAARSIGAKGGRVFGRHILPNSVGPVLIYAFTSIGVAVVAMASLAFLGIGVPVDTPEWGRLTAQAVGFLKVEGKGYLWIFPALAITIFTLAFALVADGLRDALDPEAAMTAAQRETLDSAVGQTEVADAPLLEVRDLRVYFTTGSGLVKAVDGVSWSVQESETLAIVGESGSGKSVTAMAIMGLLASPPAQFPTGEIFLRGRSVTKMSANQRRKLRGNVISMIFQDPLTALNPVYTISNQIVEMIRNHQPVSKAVARARAIDLLGEVGIPRPAERIDSYPHEFSGGMRQRVMIAMALANDPEVLLADEPTTALDVTVQAQIMALLEKLQEQRRTAIVLITHDLGVVAHHADTVNVMYAGRLAEAGACDDVFYRPRHGYTFGLLGSLTRMDRVRESRLTPIPGQPPSLANVPPGCAFHPRCEFATDACKEAVPVLEPMPGEGHLAACIHSDAVGRAYEMRANQ